MSSTSGIARFLPNDQYEAAMGAAAPNTANPFATVNDLASVTSIYTANGTVGSTRVATLTDNLHFQVPTAGAGQKGVIIGASGVATSATFFVKNISTSLFSYFQAADANNANSFVRFLNGSGTTIHELFNAGACNLAQSTTGYVGIGTAYEATSRMKIRGIGTDNTTMISRWEDSAGTTRMTVSDDGIINVVAQSNYTVSDKSGAVNVGYQYTGTAGGVNHVIGLDANLSGNYGAHTTAAIRGYFYGINTNTGVGVQGRAHLDNASMGASALQGYLTGTNWNKANAIHGYSRMTAAAATEVRSGFFEAISTVDPSQPFFAVKAVSNRETAGSGTFIGGHFEASNGSVNIALRVPAGGGNVGFGTSTPVASALLELSSETQGFLPPRMTEAQRDLIASPATALMIYNLTTNKLNLYTGASWEEVTSA